VTAERVEKVLDAVVVARPDAQVGQEVQQVRSEAAAS